MPSRPCKRSSRKWTEFRHIFAIALLLNGCTIFWDLQAIATTWIDEDNICDPVSDTFDTFYNVTFDYLVATNVSLQEATAGIHKISEEFKDIVEFLILWKVEGQLGAVANGIGCAIDSLGSIDSLVDEFNKIDDLLDDMCTGIPFCDPASNEFCVGYRIPQVCVRECVPYVGCGSVCSPSEYFGFCADGFDIPSTRITPADLGLGSVSEESIKKSITGALYESISELLGGELVTLDLKVFSFDLIDELDELKVIFDEADRSCRDLVYSESVQGLKETIDTTLFVLGLVFLIMAIMYPFVVSTAFYLFYTTDAEASLKTCIARWHGLTRKGGLPFISYISHIPSMITLFISIAAVLFVIMLVLINGRIQSEFETVIDGPVREDVQLFEDQMTSDINDSFEAFNILINDFLDGLDNATLKISRSAGIFFEEYNDVTDDIKDIPIIGPYAVDVLECVFGFLKFDDLIDRIEEIRSSALSYIRVFLTIEVKASDFGVTVEVMSQMEESRSDYTNSFNNVISEMIIRFIPLFLAYPLLVLQGLIFEIKEKICG